MRRPTAIFTQLGALIAAALLCMPAVGLAGPAEDEYRFSYPNAKGQSSAGDPDSVVAGPNGASAEGVGGEGSANGGGKKNGASGGEGGEGGEAGEGGEGGDESSTGSSVALGSGTVAELAGAGSTSSDTVPILILSLAAITAIALGFLAWRRKYGA